MKRQWTSSKTILSTLCHEFMHHLDVISLGFPNSFHTIGFYERTHRLYLAAIGHPYYPLKWRRVGVEGRQIIDWQETKRHGAKVLGRKKVRGTNWAAGEVCARPPPLSLAQTVGLIKVKISDPHGLHDWSSKEYVRDWATRQDRYEDERRLQFQMFADAIPFSRDAAIQILDVGAGYGALTQFLLEQFPKAAALCQDGSEEMAKLGRRRMAKWKGRFDYVIADFSKSGWSRPIHGTFDAVVSTIAIHNVRVPGIIEAIYKEVFQLVKPGGCFLNLDLVFVPLAKQLDWLRAAGFSDVKSYWQERREALFGGRKI